MAAITGQPMPGGPSVIISCKSLFSASVRASRRTRLTSLPEFSSAIPRRAWTIGPNRASETYHSPHLCTGKSMACSGQRSTQTPHPSQAIGSTTNSPEIAPNRQSSRHLPHAVQASSRITAFEPPMKSVRRCTRGAIRRCRSAASTSASQSTQFSASMPNAAVTLVFPVPPLPLTTTSSRIIAASPKCRRVPGYRDTARETVLPTPASPRQSGCRGNRLRRFSGRRGSP
ncbi:MAG: hypothetical protein ACD_75C00910G0004 [uncultured bacterium]|nr:MAG: hypothetical protein ACD_75C00910G0004 [uncultured bacterium]